MTIKESSVGIKDCLSLGREGKKERREEKKQKVRMAKVWMLRKLGNYSMGNDFRSKMMSLCRT